MRKIFIILLLLVCSQCQGAPFDWVPTKDPGQWAKLDFARPAGTRQIGIYDAETDLYTPLVDGKWGASEDVTEDTDVPERIRPRRPRRPRRPTGVDWSKVPKDDHTYLRGKEISKADAMIMLGASAGKIPDDRSMPRINVIGSKEKCAGPLAVAKKYSQFVSEEYRPEFWAIQRQGFQTSADPTIYIQDFEGGTARRLDGYKGDEAFEMVIKEELGRKVGPRPDNDPAKDPGWIKRLLPLLPALSGNVPWVAIAVIVVLAAIAFYRRKEKI